MEQSTNESEVIHMKRTEKGLDIIKTADSTIKGLTVCLTRKTTKNGNVRHGVVLENKHTGRHQLVGSFIGITPAWNAFKGLRRA